MWEIGVMIHKQCKTRVAKQSAVGKVRKRGGLVKKKKKK